MTKIIPYDLNLPVRDSSCTCSNDQLIHVGCDCEAVDPVAVVSCWPTGKAQGRPQTFRCRKSYAELEARRQFGPDAKVFSVVCEQADEARAYSPEYIRQMSMGG